MSANKFVLLTLLGIMVIDFLFFAACHFRKRREDQPKPERHVCELCDGRRTR